jgi:hypothetical protein
MKLCAEGGGEARKGLVCNSVSETSAAAAPSMTDISYQTDILRNVGLVTAQSHLLGSLM